MSSSSASSSLAEYLAKNYLNAEKKDKKKHKRRRLEEDESSKGWKRVGGGAAAEKQQQQQQRVSTTSPNIDSTTVQQEKETIYRDASGRRIDIALAKAEAVRRLNKEKEEKEAQEKRLNKGIVQIQQQEQQAKQLKLAHNIKISDTDRSALDEELRRKRVWNDPAAKFLSSTSRNSTSSQQVYNGDFTPNRFGIRPGPRWDGVDRSNQFEAKWFAKQQEARDREQLRYTAQEDM